MDKITKLGHAQFQIENMEKQLKELEEIKSALIIGINIDNVEAQANNQQVQTKVKDDTKTTI